MAAKANTNGFNLPMKIGAIDITEYDTALQQIGSLSCVVFECVSSLRS
jgi:hypothetical protein